MKISSSLMLHARRLWWSRYAIATIISPALIVFAAWMLPGMLRGLVLLRTVRTELLFSDHRDVNSIFRSDLSWLTWLNAINVAFGIATYRLIQMHWQRRSRNYFIDNDLATREDRFNSAGNEQLAGLHQLHFAGWPLSTWGIWIFMSLIYPFAASVETIADQREADSLVPLIDGLVSSVASWIDAVISIGMGVGIALGSLFFLAFVRASIGGIESRESGLFPGERWSRTFANWLFPGLMVKHRMSVPSLPIHIHGVTDANTKKLLPGHLQLLIGLLFSMLIYFTWLWQSIHAELWIVPRWSVGFYLLVLVFWIGRLISLVAFLFDRYRIPVGFVIFVWVLVVSEKQHYFELLSTYEKSFERQNRPPADKGHNLINALAHRPDSSKDYPDPPYLYDLYENYYHFPKWPDGKRTCVVVSASGGGIQAAAWTSKVLTSLDAKIEPFGESIGLISSVSGGSVGAMHYLANRKMRINSKDGLKCMLPPENSNLIYARANASSLESIGWGLSFPDFARVVLPFRIDRAVDRGWALEGSWWNRMGRSAADARWMSEVRMRDLIQPTIDGTFPPVIFNATTVETGQRVLISQVRGAAVRPGTSQSNIYKAVDTPIDFLDFYGSVFKDPTAVNPRLTTAVRLSATFAYVTPVALPMPVDDELILDPKLRSRLDLHLCDGGYADNTGLVSAISMFHDLIAQYDEEIDLESRESLPFDRVLFVRIEPFPASVAQATRDNRGTKGALLGPLIALSATRTSSQAERANLELSLLMNVSNAGLITQQRATAIEIGKLLKSIKVASVRAEKEVDRSKQNRLYNAIIDLKNIDLEAIMSKGEIDAEIQKHLNAFKVGLRESDSENGPGISAIAIAIDQLVQTQAKLANKGSSIEVIAALFRFDTRVDVDEHDQNDSADSYLPPLSWRLSTTDLAAIEIAWRRYEKQFDAEDEIASASSESEFESNETPWVTESLPREKSLNPRDLLNMSRPLR